MIGLLAAAAIASPPPTPRGVHVRAYELRVTHGIVQQAAKTPIGEEDWAWAPNLGVVGSRLAGPAAAQLEVSLHLAAGRRSWGAAELRIEPRIGVRLQPLLDRPGPFGGLAVGFAGDPGGVVPTTVATLGWTGPGDEVRPVFSVDARSAVPWPSTENILHTTRPSHDPGGTGVLASVGVQWVSLRGAVR